MELSDFNYHIFEEILNNHDMSIQPNSYIRYMLNQNEVNGVYYSNLLNVATAAEYINRRNIHTAWVKDNLTKLTTEQYISLEEKNYTKFKGCCGVYCRWITCGCVS